MKERFQQHFNCPLPQNFQRDVFIFIQTILLHIKHLTQRRLGRPTSWARSRTSRWRSPCSGPSSRARGRSRSWRDISSTSPSAIFEHPYPLKIVKVVNLWIIFCLHCMTRFDKMTQKNVFTLFIHSNFCLDFLGIKDRFLNYISTWIWAQVQIW